MPPYVPPPALGVDFDDGEEEQEEDEEFSEEVESVRTRMTWLLFNFFLMPRIASERRVRLLLGETSLDKPIPVER